MKKLIGIVLCAALMCSGLAGCGEKKSADGKLTDSLGTSYPLKTDNSLSVWCAFPADALEGAKNLNDLPLGKELEKQSGVHVDYIHPTSVGQTEAFNLLLASGELPDIIMWTWSTFPGGADKAINDGYIHSLNDIADKYCPDFLAAMKKYKAKKFYSTDTGQLYYFPGIWNLTEAINTGGLIVRGDWLKELGLDVPETVDEWHTALTAFKEKKGATAAFSTPRSAFKAGVFSGAYGIRLDYYVEDGKVKNGYLEKNYKEFLKTMIQWRKEGIFDKNFTTTDGKTINANMLSGAAGLTYGGQGGTMGTLLSANHDNDPQYDLVATEYPVLKKGEKCNIAKKSIHSVEQLGAAITSGCKDIELAAKWLNFGYTEKGAYTYAFGVEGESYEIKDGYPTFTDLILNNPDGESAKTMLDRYTRSATTSGPLIKDYRYLEQYSQLPQQKEALVLWSDQDGEPHDIPPLFFDEAEQSEVSAKVNAINTYQLEMLYRFITGEESLDNFDAYIDNMKKNGAQEVLDIYQKAYDRYLKR